MYVEALVFSKLNRADGSLYRKLQLDFYLTHPKIQMNSRSSICQSERKTIKRIEDNVRGHAYYFKVGKEFLNMILEHK